VGYRTGRSAPTLIIFALLAGAALRAQEPEVTVYYYERPPFFGQIGTEDEGIILRIARLVFEDARIPYRFEKLPVTRIFESLKRPGLHCVAGVFKTPERESLYSFSADPIYQDSEPHYVVRKAESADYAGLRTIGDLLASGRTLGVAESYSYGTWIDKNIASYDPPRETVNIGDDQSNFYAMLVVRRFDYFFASLEEATQLLRTNRIFSARLAVRELEDAPEGNIRWIMFSRDFPEELLARINRSIPRVKKRAEYRRIISGAIRRE
jgi:polar amino acid transport system substrate-binding protein